MELTTVIITEPEKTKPGSLDYASGGLIALFFALYAIFKAMNLSPGLPAFCLIAIAASTLLFVTLFVTRRSKDEERRFKLLRRALVRELHFSQVTVSPSERHECVARYSGRDPFGLDVSGHLQKSKPGQYTLVSPD